MLCCKCLPSAKTFCLWCITFPQNLFESIWYNFSQNIAHASYKRNWPKFSQILWIHYIWNERNTIWKTSSLRKFQKTLILINMKLNSSGPKIFKFPHSQTITFTSLSSNLAINRALSSLNEELNLTPSNFGLRYWSSLNLSLKKDTTSSLTLLGSYPQSPLRCNPFKKFSPLLQLIQEWKYLEFLSPSDTHLILDFCLNKDSLHITHPPNSSWSSIFLLIYSSQRLMLFSFFSNSLISFPICACLFSKIPNFSLFHTFNSFFKAIKFSFKTNVMEMQPTHLMILYRELEVLWQGPRLRGWSKHCKAWF